MKRHLSRIRSIGVLLKAWPWTAAFALAVGLFQNATADPLMQEAFNYTPGSDLGADAPWIGSSSSVGVGVVSDNLFFSGLRRISPAGGGLRVAGGNDEITFRSFTDTPITNGNVYFSALINCAALPGTTPLYIASLQASGSAGPSGRVDPLCLYVQGTTTGDGYLLGIRHTENDADFASTVLQTNTTHLIVMKYLFGTFAGGQGGDSQLYIDPPPGAPEPASPDADSLLARDLDDNPSTDTPDLQVVGFRALTNVDQGIWLFDTLRIGTTWADVVPGLSAFGPQNGAVCAGNPATLSVTVAGTPPFTYQWRTNGIPVSNATNSSYTLNRPGPADTLLAYDVVVSDSFDSVTSQVAHLTITTIPPSIAVPPANQIVQPASPVTFSVVATGDPPLSYQWRVNGLPISGATGQSFTVPNPRPTDALNAYDVVVANPCDSVTSSPPAHLIFPLALSGPQDRAVCPGISVAFSVVASGTPPFTYQWRASGVPINGATNSTYLLANPQPADTLQTYDVVVNDPFESLTSRAATLTLFSGPPVIDTPPASQTVLPGVSNATFTVIASSEAPLSYQWQLNGVTIPGATDSSYMVANAVPADAANTYQVVVANACGSITSSPPAQLLFGHSFLAFDALPGFLSGMNLFATNTAALALYAWSSADPLQSVTTWTLEGQLAEQPLNDGSGNSRYSINVTPATSPVYYIIGEANSGPYLTPVPVEWITTDTSGNYSLSKASVMISPAGVLDLGAPPAIDVEPISRTVLSGKSVTFSVVATGTAPLFYQWYFNSATLLTDATNGTLSLTRVTLNEAGNYTVVVINALGSITSSPAALNVLPPPVLSPIPLTAAFQVRGTGVPGDTYWLQASTNLNAPASWVTLATNTADASGLVLFLDQNSQLGASRFYRVVSP